jgi:hypothetical protein
VNRSGLRRAASAWLAALVVAMGAACGGSSSGGTGIAAQSADQIVAATIAASKSAKSVHIVGHITQSGQELGLDLQLVNGKGGAGTIEIGGQPIDIVRLGSKAYFKADANFWTTYGSAAAAKMFAGKWLMGPATGGQLASFTQLTDVRAFFTRTFSKLKSGSYSKGDETTVDGQPVITIHDSKGGVLYVATTGPPYPIKLSGKTAKSSGQMSFSDWDQPVTLTPPPHAIDMSKITGG